MYSLFPSFSVDITSVYGTPQSCDANVYFFFSLQLAMTLASQEESEFGDWEEFKRTHLGDTTGLTEYAFFTKVHLSQ